MIKPYINSYFRILLVVWLLYTSISAIKASTGYFFYVQFANKTNTPYSIGTPLGFLSQRAIDRRNAQGITIDSTDLPVNASYLAQIKDLGIQIHCSSKWLNSATVLLADSSKMNLVRALAFVTKVQYTGLRAGALPVSKKMKAETNAFNYGTASTQINQINGAYLHNAGYTGKGVLIGILDAGFNKVNVNPAFDSLRIQNRLLGTKDIAEPGANVYALDSHGANVLSIMTANLPGQYLGTAPQASFWLIRTEYAPTEYLVETDFWCAGIEFADSVGVDIINSSLGYTEFDDTQMNFKYQDMNGLVSRASRAATIASKKGIIVCNSAGNDGNKTWHYIGAPADAEGILAIGAVTAAGVASDFTSFGPSSDGRIKPEISAMGTLTAYTNSLGVPSAGNGTSYSSPVTAGMIACLLQGYKERNAPLGVEFVRTALIRSANKYSTPNNQLGYGIPDFEYALKYPTLNSIENNKYSSFEINYNIQTKHISILLYNEKQNAGTTLHIYSVTGNLMLKKTITNSITSIPTNNWAKGVYLVCLFGNGENETKRIIVN